MTTITFTIPNDQWLSSNQRLVRQAKARRSKWLRALACGDVEWLNPVPFETTMRIIAHIGYPTAAYSDPNNAHDTTKPLSDGLVDAGVFWDDNHKWVIGPDHRRDPVKSPRGFHTVRLEIEEVEL